MAGQSEEFTKALGSHLSHLLGDEFSYLKSKGEFRRESAGGLDVIALSVSAKYSPHLNVSFYFGRNFDSARAIEKRSRDYAFLYHVQQYSTNRQPLFAPEYQGPDNWSLELPVDPALLAAEVSGAIRGMAFPFFRRFAAETTARDAIACSDSHCFSGPAYWRQLLLLDVALGDLDHFKTWSSVLDVWTKEQADIQIGKYRDAGIAGV